ARAALAAATDQLASTQEAEADLRRRLAGEPMPAEVHQLELQLEANLLAQRAQLAELADAQDLVATTERARQRVAAGLDRARSQLVRASADLAVAEDEDRAADRWREALAGAPLQAVIAAARSPEAAQRATAA